MKITIPYFFQDSMVSEIWVLNWQMQNQSRNWWIFYTNIYNIIAKGQIISEPFFLDFNS